jgi:hypothetical protein
MAKRMAGVGSQVIQKILTWWSGGLSKHPPGAGEKVLHQSFTGEALDRAGVTPQERQQAVKEGVLSQDGHLYTVTKTAAKKMRQAMSKQRTRQAAPIDYDHDTGGWLLTSDLGESGHSPAIDDDQQPIKNGGLGTLASPPPSVSSAAATLDSVAKAVASVDPAIARRLKALSREASTRVAFGLPDEMGAPMGASPPAMVGGTPTASPDELYSTAVFNREDEQGCGPANDANQTRKFTHEVWGTYPANESQVTPKVKPERMQGAAGNTGRPSNGYRSEWS